MPEALPELGALAACAALLLIAAALWVTQQLLVNSLGKAPVIGSWISSTLGGWLNDARNAVLNANTQAWGAAKQLFRWGEAFARNPLVMTLALASKTWDSLARLYDVTLPSLENRAALWATSLFSQAYAAINSDFTQSLSYANGLFTRAEAVAQGWVNTALLYAADLFARAEADALALVSRAEADAANLVTQASTALQAQITSAEALAAREVSGLAASTQAAVNQLANDITSGLAGAEALAYSQVQALQRGIVTDLETIGDTAVGLAWPDAVPDINALRGVLGADFPWLNDLLGIMAGAGTAGLLGALIRSMATSQALTRLATDCIVPNCRNLSGLGNDLSQLLGIISEGALLAWLAEMVANPQGWARDTGTVLGPIGNDSISAARTLLGV